MKVLSDIDQFRKRKEEVWNLMSFQRVEMSEIEDKIRKKEDSFFSNKGAIRVLKYTKTEMDKVSRALSEYHQWLSDKVLELGKS